MRSLPLKRMADLLLKPVPFTVSVKAASPSVLLVGLMLINEGTRLLTEKLLEPDVPPPGSGLKTEMGNEPGAVKSAAVIWAVNFAALTNVVRRSLPLKRTIEPLMRPVPLTVSVNSPAPAIATVGEKLTIEGVGLMTERGSVADVPPPGAGFETAIGKVPVAAI